ncbi:hypothetical protein RSOLAG1IB_06851 [Rhizoctonia solani AG-1 IB]|uniref:CHAT domain-containing protein n=1 Tax=Thanatephorus cucumeris (strain AG1-IB / isolate 7/3/14) TaxID=1108050 RepID=A0A0B7F9E2_THACB|nr:hypothetical protein RSOLAG1IB_06851 [Rhizoctonia solani AG-1 IB]
MEKSMEYYTHAMERTPNDHPNLPVLLSNLGIYHNVRFQRLGQLEDLSKSAEYYSLALTLTPDDHPDLPRRYADLGGLCGDRYHRLGNLDDGEKSIEYYSCALALTPEGHPNLPDRYADLGLSYNDRYRRLGEMADLEKSIEYYVHALSITPDGHPRLIDRHGALGLTHADRYRRLGGIDDLEKSIKYKSLALALTPEDHPDLSRGYAALGGSYTDRYRRLGELDDLEKSIEYYSRALEIMPEDHPGLPRRYANLGVSYHDRFRRLGEITDLERSIEYYSRAISITPEGHPDLPLWNADLGVSYHDRYGCLRRIDDLEKAIEYKSQALALTPEDHPYLPDRHTELGDSYINRYQRLGELSDLQKATECNFRALSLTPDEHPDLPLRHFYWAISHYNQYQHTSDPSHLEISLSSFRKASQLSTGAPRDVFSYAHRWAKLATERTYLNPIEAFRATIDLLPHFIWLGATTTQRYFDLSLAENLAVRAASVAIQSSEYSLALEWLEYARCVVWNQALTLRSPVDSLSASNPALATQFQSVAQQLRHANSQSPDSQSAIYLPEHRHRLAREYGSLLAEIRELPGFVDFLRPKKLNELVRAARNGPIIVINCYESHCDALIIIPRQDHISHVALPNFTEQKTQHTRVELEMWLRRGGLRERGVRRPVTEPDADIGLVLVDMWNDLVRPVLDHLGYLDNDPADDLPHITWCPTGAASFLPLHAAGDYDQPRSCVFDYVISSYTPTLSALLTSAPTVQSPIPQVLAIGQEATPGYSPLPGTTRELTYVKTHTQGRAGYSQLTGSQATTTAVLDAMEQYDWVHLACHAHQDVIDPTSSGFFLHNGTLDLAAINQRSLRNKGLAFLSACQTATGDRGLPDEAIHLASGMLMAGYTSVIATMWSVVDDDAPFVADKVYAQLMRDGKVGNGEAGKALHYAVARLREKVGEKEFGRDIFIFLRRLVLSYLVCDSTSREFNDTRDP